MGDKISRPATFDNSKPRSLRRRSLSSPINRSNILVAASYQAGTSLLNAGQHFLKKSVIDHLSDGNLPFELDLITD